MGKITSKDLIAMKTDIEKRKNERLHVTIGDLGDWEFMVPSAADMLDAQAYETHHGKTADSVGDVYLVYSMCVAPDLHDQELQEAYGTKGPGIVNALLRPGEVQELTEALMEKAGYVDKSVVEIEKAEEVKN
ncbi:MAG: hypothetical protein E7K64_00785 [Clostridia bacterium]|nr:hypothetical protein [Clostridiales bacterium]MDU7471357.1 hypothetical protein [Serratia marcescens]MDU7504567.1 hypothetical protein [Clostridia bacterium]